MKGLAPGIALAVALAGAVPLAAQETGGPRERLIAQVMERFMENYRTQAGLTPEQNDKFRAALRRSFEQRRELQQRERMAWRALEQQMRPGVAANADSVTKLIDATNAAKAAFVEQARAEQREYAAFLTPVQRAQLVIQHERFQNQLEEMVRRRMEQMRPGRQGGDR